MSASNSQQLPTHPRKRSVSPKVKKPKPELRLLEHAHFGLGTLLSVRQVDSGNHVATVKFDDGVERVLQLQPQYWTTDIATLIPAPLKPRRAAKPKPEPVGDDASSATGEDSDPIEELRAA